ncbi:MAG: DUF2231 domain-containing protein [Prochloraceae cyanobacterium]
MEYIPHLNDHNLPYHDTLHPIVVQFVISIFIFACFFDLVDYLRRNHLLYEVSWWNMFFATISIFIAIIFGQVEAGLAQPYEAVEPVLNLHTLIGWSLSGIIAAITAWRYIIRARNPEKVPIPYLGTVLVLVFIVGFQMYLGDKLVWVYGVHTVPIVEAIKEGILQ